MVAFMLTAMTNNDSPHRTGSTLVEAAAFAISPLARAMQLPVNATFFSFMNNGNFFHQPAPTGCGTNTTCLSWASLPPTRTYQINVSSVLSVAVPVWPRSISAHTIASPAPLGLSVCRLGRSLRLSSCFWSLCRQLTACDFRVKLKFFLAFTRFATCRHSIPQDAKNTRVLTNTTRTKIDYGKKLVGTLILTSLLEDLG